MTDPDRDLEFEAYLRRRSVLSERERGADNLEPPHDLDDIVLRKARQAIQAPKELPLYRAPRWALPVGIVATILLCLSVALNVSLNSHRPEEPVSPGATVAVPEDRPALSSAPPTTAPSTTAPSTVAPSTPAPAAAAPAAPRTGPADAISLKSTRAPQEGVAADAGRDPDAWLEQIRALRAAGKTAAADAEWRRFRAAFPSFPVGPAVLPPGPVQPSGPGASPPSEPPKRPLQ
jgi:hypothetical protein